MFPRLPLVIAVLFGIACGRVGFEPRITGDAVSDTIPLARCHWDQGVNLGPLLAHPELSSSRGEFDPYLQPGDPLTITFASDRDMMFKTYVATRPSLAAPFGAPTIVPGLDGSIPAIFAFNLLRGGLRGYISKETAMHEVSRAALSAPIVIGRELTELTTPPGDADPFPSPDDLTLTWTSGPGDDGDIYQATRPDPSSPWGPRTKLGISTAGHDSGPTLTSDELVIVFQADFDLYYATRATKADPFGPAQLLLATSAMELELFVREDGCEVFFVQSTAANSTDIFSATIIPL